MMNKTELRKEIRNRKRQYTQEQLQALSAPIIDRLRHHPKLVAAKTIMLYHSLPDEVFTHTFVDEMVEAGKDVLLPVVISETEMEIRRYTGSKDMAMSSFNILEPIGELFTDYDNIEFIAVPGMSFDADRNRLGRGKGYYDRFLKQAERAYKLGICFDFQKLDSIPTDKYDEKVDEVL
ncbi:5-formyltetrahydrofolate cyclo-ligase [Prevotella falsenii]|uniref:5-formyltetrahydrofolate cyclo-ligase n=1 Tax=Prevotella falsenii TaxID=515414 RepID=UPI0004681312|nr:5-formyltetrahydrofolate cyclo-ligase [Prevotella falsenii]